MLISNLGKGEYYSFVRKVITTKKKNNLGIKINYLSFYRISSNSKQICKLRNS